MRKLISFSVLSLVALLGASTSTQARPTPTSPASLSCSSVWECELCSNGRPRNVRYEYCDDGSSRPVYTGPCGQACY